MDWHFLRVISYRVFPLVRNMLSNLGKEVQRVEDLEIPVHSCTEIAAGRFRKAPAILMFRLVDHMSGRGYLQFCIFSEAEKINRFCGFRKILWLKRK